MRIAFAAILLAPIAAAAGPIPGSPGFADVVVQPPRHATGPRAFTQVSHLIYLNNCLPNGCTINPGNDDSRTQTSSIPQSQAHLAAWQWGPDNWNKLVQCVKDMYGPYNVQITDQDPGASTPHFELVVGGNSTDVGVDGAGGVAPFIPCDGQLQDNVISYVFASETQDLDYLCWAAAQETSHVFGLDHEMEATDPMTYLSPPVKKPGFQNKAVSCGEYQNRACWCSNPTQNSAQYLMDTFGPQQLEPATLSIDSPADGSWVKPGFVVRGTSMSQLSTTTATLQIDGTNAATATDGTLVFNAPMTLAGGDHMLTVNATDTAARMFGSSITVHVTATCVAGGSCDKNFGCLGGFCLPEADVTGGLGAACTQASDCITNSCGTDGTDHLCTAACDNGTTCPSGYSCLSAESGGGVCWPAAPSSGGCTTGGGGGPLFAFAGLGALLVVTRRRRTY